MRVSMREFAGMVPLLDDAKLPKAAASYAANVRFDGVMLRPYGQLNAVSATLRVNTQTIFLYEDTHWFSFDEDVDIVDSPINNDDSARVYWTGESIAPRMSYNSAAVAGAVKPSNSYRMGVQQPNPPVIGTITDNDQNAEGADDDQTRFYVYTYVNSKGEEGMPSTISDEVTILAPGATVAVGIDWPTVNDQDITHARIYRTAGNSYRLVTQLSLGTPAYIDDKSDSQLGVVLDTFTFAEPIQTMRGLTQMANGILAGYADNTVCFSEAFLPHAWPVDYQLTCEDPVVAMKPIGNSLIVTTTGKPYIFTGISPDAISGRQIELAQACVSKRSMVDMGEYVIYASPDGLVLISQNRAELITRELFDKKAWQAYQPDTIHAAMYEGKYVAFYGNSAGFVFDVETGNFVELDFYVTALYTDLKDDALYMVQSNSLFAFDESGANMTYTWRKRMRLDKFVSPACAYVETNDPANTGFILRVDNVEILNLSDLSDPLLNQGDGDHPLFRLPQLRGNWLEIEINGTADVLRVALGDNMSIAQHG